MSEGEYIFRIVLSSIVFLIIVAVITITVILQRSGFFDCAADRVLSKDDKGLGRVVNDFERGYKAGQSIGFLAGLCIAAVAALVVWLLM
jgi:hypothetical protein